MYVLVVDSSTAAVTAAVARLADLPAEAGATDLPTEAGGADAAGGAVLAAARSTVDARAHGELLAPEVHAVLAEAGLRPRDLVAVVAGVGPGPFTGLRVGLATAAAFGQALTIPTYGVCSLDGIGFGRDGTVLVATDARRREVYWALYAGGVRVAGPEVARPDALTVDADYAVGEGARRYADQLGLPVRDEPGYPSALALAVLAADRIRAGAPSERLTPLYLRRPDAVEPPARKPVLS